jgi:hypothetical protein
MQRGVRDRWAGGGRGSAPVLRPDLLIVTESVDLCSRQVCVYVHMRLVCLHVGLHVWRVNGYRCVLTSACEYLSEFVLSLNSRSARSLLFQDGVGSVGVCSSPAQT